MVVERGPGEDGLDLDVDKDDVSVGSQRHLEHCDISACNLHDEDCQRMTRQSSPRTWKVKAPPAGCSASAITETLLHSTVSRSGSDNTEMVEELDREGSS